MDRQCIITIVEVRQQEAAVTRVRYCISIPEAVPEAEDALAAPYIIVIQGVPLPEEDVIPHRSIMCIQEMYIPEEAVIPYRNTMHTGTNVTVSPTISIQMPVMKNGSV